jgi:hypothetical protein
VLSLAVLVAGALGLLVAIEIAPGENLDAQAVLTGQPIGLTTVTGPGGRMTVALTRTKDGETRLTPVRVIRTVTGPSGAALQTQTLSDTEVVTTIEPVTVVVTNRDEVTVTETVVLEVTTTVSTGKTGKTKP